MDAVRALTPMFLFLLTPVLIPVVAVLVGWLSDSIARRSRRKRRPVARRVRQVEADTPQVIAS